MKKTLIMLTAFLLAMMIPMAAFAEKLTFSTTTLQGEKYDSSMISDYRLIMVNVWAEWCGPCVGELPELAQLYKNYKDDLLILGVWIGNDTKKSLKIAKEAGVTYPLLKCDSNLQELSYRSQYVPATYYYDRTGKQIGAEDGYIGARDYESWKQIVDELMAKTTPVSATDNGLKYKLDGKKKTAELTGPVKKNITSAEIPQTITVEGKTYKVNSIAPDAFSGRKKLASLTIGENVKKIGAGAFKDCENLSRITIMTTKLTSGSIGDEAFANIRKKAVITCPARKLKAYKKILLTKGISKKAVFTK